MSTSTIAQSRTSSFVRAMRGLIGPKPGHVPNLFGASATILSISAVYCYFMGYIFSYFFYYQGFGVTLESLDLSPQFYFMRAYTVLQSPGGMAVLAGLALVMSLYLGRKLRTGVMLVAMLGAFPLLFQVSESEAHQAFTNAVCMPVHTIHFAFRDDAVTPMAAQPNTAKQTAGPDSPATSGHAKSEPNAAEQLEKLSAAGELALLLETKDRIVVYGVSNCYPLGPKGPEAVPSPDVYTLLRSDLEFAEVTVL